MYKAYNSFVGATRAPEPTARQLQLILVHPSDHQDYYSFYKLEQGLPEALQTLLTGVTFEVPIYLQNQLGLPVFQPYNLCKDSNCVLSFNALCQLMTLFDSADWDKRKDYVVSKALEELNQPTFISLCPTFKRLVPSNRQMGTFMFRELLEQCTPTLALYLRVEAKTTRSTVPGQTVQTVTAFLEYYKTTNDHQDTYTFETSLTRLEELVLKLKPHLVSEREVVERANASLDIMTQAIQENDLYSTMQFAQSPPLPASVPPTHYSFGIAAKELLLPPSVTITSTRKRKPSSSSSAAHSAPKSKPPSKMFQKK
jgi:hypothetical protein